LGHPENGHRGLRNVYIVLFIRRTPQARYFLSVVLVDSDCHIDRVEFRLAGSVNYECLSDMAAGIAHKLIVC
jgi:hypothetical protein